MASRQQMPNSPLTAATQEERQQRIAEAAKRALAEAEARRESNEATSTPSNPTEKGGQAGPDPARYGDWEKDGIASDF